MQLLDLIQSPWAIEPAMLREIQAIYERHAHGEQPDLAALEAKLGRPLANEQQEYSIEDGGIAVLPLEGVMGPKANMFMRISGGVSTQLMQKQIESAIADPRVKGLVLSIDSPGGSVFGTPELAKTIFDAAQTKSVVAVAEARMASAAYWAGSATNAIYISGPTVEVGSIGVVGTHKHDPKGAEGTTEIVAGKYKRIATPNAPLSKEGREYLQGQVDHVYTVFANAVADHRGVPVDTVLEHMAEGRVFIGQQAIDVGLVDGFATVDDIVARMAADPAAFASRRKAQVFKTTGTTSKGGVSPPSSQPGASMDLEKLKAEHPALFTAIDNAAFARGATAERERIQAVEGALIPGHEKLIAALKFDGKTTGGDAALAVNAAERAIREKQGAAANKDAPPPVANVPATTVPAAGADDGKVKAEADRIAALPVDERCKAMWDANTDNVRADHVGLAEFTAYTKAVNSGKVKVMGRSKAA